MHHNIVFLCTAGTTTSHTTMATDTNTVPAGAGTMEQNLNQSHYDDSKTAEIATPVTISAIVIIVVALLAVFLAVYYWRRTNTRTGGTQINVQGNTSQREDLIIPSNSARGQQPRIERESTGSVDENSQQVDDDEENRLENKPPTTAGTPLASEEKNPLENKPPTTAKTHIENNVETQRNNNTDPLHEEILHSNEENNIEIPPNEQDPLNNKETSPNKNTPPNEEMTPLNKGTSLTTTERLIAMNQKKIIEWKKTSK